MISIYKLLSVVQYSGKFHRYLRIVNWIVFLYPPLLSVMGVEYSSIRPKIIYAVNP
jgi:hypothetical protein